MLSNKTRQSFTPLVILILMLIMAGCGGQTPPESEMHTIGILNTSDGLNDIVAGFQSEMAEQGYVEGENVTYIYDGDLTAETREAGIAALLENELDLIFASSTTDALAVQAVAGDIPIIFGISTSPVSEGLIDDLTQPGHNTTGILMRPSYERQLELLQEAVPDLDKVYVPYDPNNFASSLAVQAIQAVAPDLGIELVTREVLSPDENAAAIAEIPEDVDGIFFGPDGTVLAGAGAWIEASTARQIPISVPFAPLPEPGYFIGYGVNFLEMGKQSVHLVTQVLAGTNAGSIPVENAEFFIAVSMPASNALGIEYSDSLLERADYITYEEDSAE